MGEGGGEREETKAGLEPKHEGADEVLEPEPEPERHPS